MFLPRLDQPQRLVGLYVFDFGEWTAAGYTAEEIAILLEQEQYRDGRVYKIRGASPAGHVELSGVSRATFAKESGIFFFQPHLDAARRDFEQLRLIAEKTPPPCRAFIHLYDRRDESNQRCFTALIYPAEYEDEIGSWLIQTGYKGGLTVEGGPSRVTNFYQDNETPLERAQLWSKPAIQSRSVEQVLAEVRSPLQRLGSVA